MVDEINQGMDERNERLVFDRIVQSCCNDPRQPHQKLKPQYFLVTPKLLPAMRAMEHDDITVLMVYNGPGLQFDWVRGNPIFVAASAIASNRSAMTSSSSVKGPTTSSFSSSVVKDERILGKRVAESDHSDEKKKMAPSLQNLIKIQSDNIVKHELVSKSATSKPVITKPSQSSSSLVPMKFERQVFEILDSDEEDPKSKRVKQDKSEQKENMRANSSSLGGARRGEVIFVD